MLSAVTLFCFSHDQFLIWGWGGGGGQRWWAEGGGEGLGGSGGKGGGGGVLFRLKETQTKWFWHVNEEIIFSLLIPWCHQDPEPFGGLMKSCRVCCETSIKIWAACEVFQSSLRVSLNVPKMWFLKCWNYAGVILCWNRWRKRTVVHSFLLFNAQSAAEVGRQVVRSQVMVDSLPTLHVALCLKRVGGWGGGIRLNELKRQISERQNPLQ